MNKPARTTRPKGSVYARWVAFLGGFAALVIFVSRYYLLPAMEAAGRATGPERRILSAHSLLLLALLLVILLCGLMLVFRAGRWFMPRRPARTPPTRYPDAWAESARRIEVDDEA